MVHKGAALQIINLPVIGTAEDPTPCRGDMTFSQARTGRERRRCQAICRSCSWLEPCRQAADKMLAEGEKLWGVWGGRCYRVDNDPVTSVTTQQPDTDTADDRPGSDTKGGSHGTGAEARHEADVRGGYSDPRLGDIPTRVVRFVGARRARTSDRAVREMPGVDPGGRHRLMAVTPAGEGEPA